MATKIKMEWKPVKIGNYREAFVACYNGQEIGSLSRYTRKDAWIVTLGLGAEAKDVGKSYSKEGEKFMLSEAYLAARK